MLCSLLFSLLLFSSLLFSFLLSSFPSFSHSLILFFCPQNLLLSATGQLKLADFGFAVLLEGLSKEERCRPVGSPNYMAPELLSGAAAADNYEMELIDIYDAGCILFVMCAGHLPFPEEGEVLFNKIIAGAMAFPRHFSPNLTSLLSHVMDSDWRRRYSLPQIKSHPWMKREETKSPRPESPSPGIAPVPIPVPAPARRAPEILASNGKADKSMTFSDLTMVTVVPKKKEPALSSPRGGDGGVPFINCFEFLANVGIFDLSRMLVKVCVCVFFSFLSCAERSFFFSRASTTTTPFLRRLRWSSSWPR